jgi:hypothetical protein
MYVNYCGGDQSRIMERIRNARSECARRRGPVLNIRDVVEIAVDAA